MKFYENCKLPVNMLFLMNMGMSLIEELIYIKSTLVN